MNKWYCQVCGTPYDPQIGDDEDGVPPEAPFEQLPEDWVCPTCGATKSNFRKAK